MNDSLEDDMNPVWRIASPMADKEKELSVITKKTNTPSKKTR